MATRPAMDWPRGHRTILSPRCNCKRSIASPLSNYAQRVTNYPPGQKVRRLSIYTAVSRNPKEVANLKLWLLA
jgi:hypothetical protein